MPTKPNKSGGMQPYVPAGNGDESGEYRDNAYGGSSNQPTSGGASSSGKWWESSEYKQPDQPAKKEEEPIGVEVKGGDIKPEEEQGKSKDEGVNRLKEAITSTFLANQKSKRLSSNQQQLLSNLDGSDDETAELVADYVDKYQPEIKVGKKLRSCYKSGLGEINLGDEALQDYGIYSKGGTIYHELGHAIDNTDNTAQDFDFFGFRRKGYYSSNFKSQKYGMTLSDMVEQEIGSREYEEYFNAFKSYNTENVEKAKKEYEDFKAQNKSILDAAQTEIQNILDNDPARIYNKQLREKYQNGEISFNDYYNGRKDTTNPQQAIEQYRANHPEYVAYDKKSQELYDKILEEERKPKLAFGDISDMVEATHYKAFCGGHGRSYWREDGRNRGTEAFAEIMSAKATNPESYAMMKKYIPKTLEIYEEIIKEVKTRGKEY